MTRHKSLPQPMWVIRAGERREAHDLLVSHGRVVLSDPGLGDLSFIDADREAFLAAYRLIRPDDSPTGSATIAKGKFFRFVHDMQVGDTVIYLSVKEQRIYVGRVTSAYFYDEEFSATYPHQRHVKWRTVFPKSLLSDSARGELGAARSFYMYKRHVNEINSAVSDEEAVSFKDWMAQQKQG